MMGQNVALSIRSGPDQAAKPMTSALVLVGGQLTSTEFCL